MKKKIKLCFVMCLAAFMLLINTTSAASLQIGDTYQGGIVFYINSTGNGGLIAAPSNQGANIFWGCSGTNVSGTATALNTGKGNTSAIVAACATVGTAARICDDLVLGGKDDWYLPSKEELNLMYQNLRTRSLGGLTGQFWSSSQVNANVAWRQSFSDGRISDAYKTARFNVRAVRVFTVSNIFTPPYSPPLVNAQVIEIPTGLCPATVTDMDGNLYNTVKIGAQCWMKENLKTTKYRNGDFIRNGQNNWGESGTLDLPQARGAYCVYGNNPTYNNVYGKVYNHYAVWDSRSICPYGWHIPSKLEWDQLFDFLGGRETAAPKLFDDRNWEHGAGSGHVIGTNSSGFSILPGGWGSGTHFNRVGSEAVFWTSTTEHAHSDLMQVIFKGTRYIYIYNTYNISSPGFSCRCIKD